MKVFELFSRRLQDEAQSGKTEVFQYEAIPEVLRRQIRKIAKDGLGAEELYTGYGSIRNETYETIWEILCREYGKDYLCSHRSGPYEDLMSFMLTCSTVEFLDCTEMIATAMDRVVRDWPQHEKERWSIGDVDELL